MTTDIENATYKGYGTNKKNSRPANKRKVPEQTITEPEGPPDWKKFKKEKKDVLLQRKKSAAGGDEGFELNQEAKKIWAELRRGDCGKESKDKLTKKLYLLIKGKVYNLIKAHDTVRVIQCLLKNSGDEIRSCLFVELKGHLIELMKSKYSKFFIIKMLDCGTKNQRKDIMEAMMGRVVRLMKHTHASDVVELAYNDYANEGQRSLLMQEFYGPRFRILKGNYKNLNDAIEDNKDRRKTILADVQSSLQPIIEKGVFTNTMIHTLLKEFMSSCDDSDRIDIIESVGENLLPIIHSRDGARFAMMCLWYSTTKQRKVILKSMKTHFVKMACEPHAHMVLLAAFDCVDDTVFVKKAIIAEMMTNVQELLGNLHGRKVVQYLISPRNKSFFSPDIVAILAKGDGNANTKKNIDTIHEELQDSIHQPVLKAISDKIQEWYKSPQMVLFLGLALKTLKGEETSVIYEKLVEICAQPYITTPDDKHFLDMSVVVKLVTYIISFDKESHQNGKPVFSQIFLESAETELVSFTFSNRGCFILIHMIETGIPEVVTKITNKLKPIENKLSKMEHAGGKILAKKIRGE